MCLQDGTTAVIFRMLKGASAFFCDVVTAQSVHLAWFIFPNLFVKHHKGDPEIMRLFFVAIIAILSHSSSATAGVITLRADEWCPFNCEPGANPGYGIEIFTLAMTSAGHTVDYKIEPWARALDKAMSGEYHAVIGANAGEVKEFKLKTGAEPIAQSADCVFARSENKIKFSKVSDLGKFQRIGIINDYDYSDEIQSWINDPKNASRTDAVSGQDPLALNLKKLEGGRIDAVIEDRSVMEYKLKQMALEQKITIAGCIKPAKLFIAFSAARPETSELVKALDQTISKLRKSGELKKILGKYGIKDWK